MYALMTSSSLTLQDSGYIRILRKAQAMAAEEPASLHLCHEGCENMYCPQRIALGMLMSIPRLGRGHRGRAGERHKTAGSYLAYRKTCFPTGSPNLCCTLGSAKR